MPPMEDERQIRFYCPEHKRDFVVPAGKGVTVSCGNQADEHALTRDFPGKGFWEYCCDCKSFFPLRQSPEGDSKPTNNICPVCGRASGPRFLCSRCNVVSFESSWEGVSQVSPYSISATTGRIQPHCPGCLKKLDGAVRHHKCRLQRIGFTTTRESCPFCKEKIHPNPPELGAEVGAYAVASSGGTLKAETAARIKLKEESPRTSGLAAQQADGNGHKPAAESRGEEAGRRTDDQTPAAEADRHESVNLAHRLRRNCAKLIIELRKRRKRYIAAAVSLATVAAFLLTQPVKNWIRRWGPNHPPVITMVRPDKNKVSVDGIVTLTATARDDDNDEVHYYWQTSTGKFDGDTDKDVVTLNLAGSGAGPDDKITVRVFANDKEETGRSFDTEIQVSSNHKPRLPPIQQNATQVYLGDMVTLTANPHDEDRGDMDALKYHWSTSGGVLDGDTTHSPRVVLNTAGVNILASEAQVVVKLTVEDKNDFSEEQTATVTVVPKRQDREPPPTPQGEAANNSAVGIYCPDGSAVEAGGHIRLQALPDNINVNEFTFEWKPDDQRLQFVAEGAQRFVGKGREVTLDTAGLKALTSRREVTILLTVTNLQTRKSRSLAQTVTVLPADAKSPGPVPSAHPEPSASASPTASPSPKAEPLRR
jgi:hypothetical protein